MNYTRSLPLQSARLEIVKPTPGALGTYWHEVDCGRVRAYVHVAVEPDDHYVCLGVAFDARGEALTAQMVKNVRLEALVGEAFRGMTGDAEFRANHDVVTGLAKSRAGRGPVSDQKLEAFAEVYRQALDAAPRSPMKWVRERLGKSETTVYRWRDEARVRGFLGLEE